MSRGHCRSSSLLSSIFTSLGFTSILSTSSSLLRSLVFFFFSSPPRLLQAPRVTGRAHVVQCNNTQVLPWLRISVLRISTFAPHFCRSNLQRLTAHLRRPLISRICFSPRLRFALSTHPSPSLAPSLRVPLFCPCSCSLPYLGSIVPPVARRRQTPPPWIPFAPLSGHPNIIAALPRQPAPPSAPRPATAAAPAHSLRSDHNRNSNDSYDDNLSTLSRPTSQLIASVALSLALLFWHPARPTRPLMIPFWSLLVLFIYPV